MNSLKFIIETTVEFAQSFKPTTLTDYNTSAQIRKFSFTNLQRSTDSACENRKHILGENQAAFKRTRFSIVRSRYIRRILRRPKFEYIDQRMATYILHNGFWKKLLLVTILLIH